MAVTALLVSPFIALIPARAYHFAPHDATHVAAITGWLTTAQGIGAVIGALSIAPLAHRFGRRFMLLFNITTLPAVLMVYAVAPSEWLAVGLLGVVGALYMGVLSGLMTVVSLWAPTALRGRILSLYLVALGAIYPLGGLIQGWFADRIGLAETTIIGAAGLLAVLTGWRLTRPTSFEPLTDPDEMGIDPETLVFV